MTNSGNILWADDEIDLLKPHILFLESKGYRVEGVTNGLDALEKVQESGLGALIYLRQEGRGIGLVKKLKAYRLQQQEAMDTVDANLAIGEPEDARDYLIGALILKSFGIKKVRLVTNNPSKVSGLEKYGIEVTERVPHVIPPSEHNAKYLHTKKQRMGHLI